MRHRHGLTAVIVISLLVVVLLGAALYFLAGGAGGPGDGESLTVYCAAGILPPVQEAAERYEREYGTRIVFSTGNSGELREKIKLRGGADLYIPADDSFVQPLADAGMVRWADPIASFRLVVAVQPGNPAGIAALDDLFSDGVAYGLCVPEAGAGKRTRAALEAAGDWDRVWAEKKSSFGTVTEAATQVKLGHLDAAIVWDAVAKQRGLAVVSVPELAESEATITAAVLTASDQPAAAARFVRYLTAADKGGPAFARHQYATVGGSPYEREPVIELHIGTVSEPAVRQTIAEFEAEHGVRVLTKYAGCGELQSIQSGGGTPDGYLACDISYRPRFDPTHDEPEVVSKMDLVILVPPGNPKGITSLRDLLRDGVTFHVSNPQNTAMGGLTRDLLRDAVGRWEGLDAFGMKVQSLNGHTMALQLATGGGHDAAIAYAVNGREYVERGELQMVPIDHPRANAVQGLWVADGSRHHRLVAHLLEKLRSSMSVERYRAAGFRPASADPADPPPPA